MLPCHIYLASVKCPQWGRGKQERTPHAASLWWWYCIERERKNSLGCCKTALRPHVWYSKQYCVLYICEPVDVSISQQIMESSGVFSGGNQSGHVVHHLRRRNPAVWHKAANINWFFSPLSFHSYVQIFKIDKKLKNVWSLESSWRLPSPRTSRRFLMVLVISPSLV